MAIKKYLDYTGLTELVAKLKERYGNAFTWKGSVANIAALPAISGLTTDNVGSVYNVIAAGTTTSDFVEGAGHVLPAGSNVVLSNVGTDQVPVLKWDVLGVFDISDKLTWVTTMPASPSDGDIVIFLGETTYTYTTVTPVGDEDPAALGWYHSDDGGTTWTAATEHTVDTTTYTYATRAEQYVQGVIYQYDLSTTSWVGLSSGDTMVAITTAEVDALFE